MSRKAHGQVRQSQVITTYGPGALIDLPRYSAIVGGLDSWPQPADLAEITEPRLTHKLELMTRVPAPRLFAPPPDSNDPREATRGIGAYRFPEWFVVQEAAATQDRERSRSCVAAASWTTNHSGKRYAPMPRVASRGSFESGGGAKSRGAGTRVISSSLCVRRGSVISARSAGCGQLSRPPTIAE